MFERRFRLFQLLGFEVKIDLSWFFLAFLITWTLAAGWFPNAHEGLSESTYWFMGVAGAIGLFLSIVFHELSHSIVARKYGIPMRGITLFIFGGVAEMTEEPPNAKSEFMMAIAGPIASIVLGLGFYGVGFVDWGVPVQGVISYLAYINLILAAFNLVPAFPLDGGRVLRSALWGYKKNLRWATRIASRIGSGFGILLIALGVVAFVSGNFIGGVWWFLIGMFLRGASKMSFQRLLIRRALEGEKIERFVKTDPITVTPSTSLTEFVEDYLYKHDHKMFPVVEQSTLKGCITTKQVKQIPKEEWEQHTVGDVSDACSESNTISTDTDAVEALSSMRRSNNSRLMAVDNGKLVGVVSLKDMLDFLALKVELEDDETLKNLT